MNEPISFPGSLNEPTDQPTKKRTWMLRFLLRGHPQLLARFFAHYQYLRRLPRRMRKHIVQRTAVTIAGAALLLALGGSPVRASTITVGDGEVAIADNGICSLIEAIQNANDSYDGLIHADCVTGYPSRADVIILPTGGTFTLTTLYSYYYGHGTGLPLSSSSITIEGNDSTIKRDSGSDSFRLLAVGSEGDLILNSLFLQGGEAGEMYDNQSGGAIYNAGILSISDSTLSGNTATRYGGAVYNYHGTMSIYNSTLSENMAGYSGGGIANSRESLLTVH